MAGFATSLMAAIVICSIFHDPSEAATPMTKGDDALIPCKATKSGSNLSYQWARGTSSSPLSEHPELKGRVSVTGNGALLINRFTKKDHGKYVCVIKSGNSLLEEVPIDVDNKYVLKAENCYSGSCIEADKCSAPSNNNLSCPDDGEVCCSFIKQEDKHRCKHFDAECMDSCNAQLQRNADDCPNNQVCCVLVN